MERIFLAVSGAQRCEAADAAGKDIPIEEQAADQDEYIHDGTHLCMYSAGGAFRDLPEEDNGRNKYRRSQGLMYIKAADVRGLCGPRGYAALYIKNIVVYPFSEKRTTGDIFGR